jgi:hypothetical protein
MITLMMEVHTSEVSICLSETTQHHILEGFHLHTHHCESMESRITATDEVDKVVWIVFVSVCFVKM